MVVYLTIHLSQRDAKFRFIIRKLSWIKLVNFFGDIERKREVYTQFYEQKLYQKMAIFPFSRSELAAQPII